MRRHGLLDESSFASHHYNTCTSRTMTVPPFPVPPPPQPLITTQHILTPGPPYSYRAVLTAGHPQLRDLLVYSDIEQTVSVACYSSIATHALDNLVSIAAPFHASSLFSSARAALVILAADRLCNAFTEWSNLREATVQPFFYRFRNGTARCRRTECRDCSQSRQCSFVMVRLPKSPVRRRLNRERDSRYRS